MATLPDAPYSSVEAAATHPEGSYDALAAFESLARAGVSVREMASGLGIDTVAAFASKFDMDQETIVALDILHRTYVSTVAERSEAISL